MRTPQQEAMFYHVEWEDDGKEGWIAKVEGLGTVRIYRDSGGNCVDINGLRAWSAWRESIGMMKLSINRKIREWKYISSFSVGPM